MFQHYSPSILDELHRFNPSRTEYNLVDHGLETGMITPAALHETNDDGLTRLLADTGVVADYWATHPKPGPCPSWCKLPAGHEYDSGEGSTWVRGHGLTVGGDQTMPVSVEIDADETVVGVDGTPRLGEPHITVTPAMPDDLITLTADQASQLTALLQTAAEKLRRIAGVNSTLCRKCGAIGDHHTIRRVGCDCCGCDASRDEPR